MDFINLTPKHLCSGRRKINKYIYPKPKISHMFVLIWRTLRSHITSCYTTIMCLRYVTWCCFHGKGEFILTGKWLLDRWSRFYFDVYVDIWLVLVRFLAVNVTHAAIANIHEWFNVKVLPDSSACGGHWNVVPFVETIHRISMLSFTSMITSFHRCSCFKLLSW